jgi:hypothetical protein
MPMLGFYKIGELFFYMAMYECSAIFWSVPYYFLLKYYTFRLYFNFVFSIRYLYNSLYSI